MAPFYVGQRLFPSKTAATEYIRELLHRPNPARFDKTETGFLLDLLKLHPSAESKIGPGIEYFFTRSAINDTTCFCAKRIDGTDEDFSLYKCLSPSKASVIKSEVMAALRWAIHDQIVEFRESLPSTIVCSLTGVALGNREGHADHYGDKEFRHIAHEFLLAKGIPYADIRRGFFWMPPPPPSLEPSQR